MALLTPALATVLALFVYPMVRSVAGAFAEGDRGDAYAHFGKAIELYSGDMVFTLLIVSGSTLAIGALALTIAGYLTLGNTPWAVAALRWLYRWPLFIPFVVAAQCMRTFLAKNGILNNTLDTVGLIDVANASGLLDWRGIVMAFVWKQAPFAALLVAGAMASLDRSMIDAARNLGASRFRVLYDILLPQVRPTLVVALVLSFVTMMSVLSVPLMISGHSPTMLTVDMAFRINSYGDYGTANALGVISYLFTAVAAWAYLRHGIREGSAR